MLKDIEVQPFQMFSNVQSQPFYGFYEGRLVMFLRDIIKNSPFMI